jgi:hypothetical protein
LCSWFVRLLHLENRDRMLTSEVLFDCSFLRALNKIEKLDSLFVAEKFQPQMARSISSGIGA